MLRHELRALYKLAPSKHIESLLDKNVPTSSQQDNKTFPFTQECIDSIIEVFCDSIKTKNVEVSTLALQSCKLFIENDIVTCKTLQIIAETVTKIEFTSTETELVEEGYHQALRVCRTMIECRKSYLLTNASVLEMIILCFRFLNSKLVRWLRQKAERTLMAIIRQLFRKLDSFPDDPNLKPSYHITLRLGGVSSQSTFKELADQHKVQGNAADSSNTIQTLRIINEKHLPYNLALINDFFCYLSSLINPDVEGDNQKTIDAKISLGLRLLTVAFQEAPFEIGQKSSLLQITRNSICYSIVTILKTSKSLPILTQVLNLATDIFIQLRMHLKYQFEIFLERLMDMLVLSTESLGLSPRSVAEVRSDALETVLELFGNIKHFAHELYYNYDCDPYSANVFENLVQLCSKNCFQHSSAHASIFTQIQLISFKTLLYNLSNVYEADMENEQRLVPSYPIDTSSLNYFPSTFKEINDSKRKKRLLWLAIEKFNAKAKEGVKFMIENNLLCTDDELVDFLKDNVKIDKKQLGEFLSKEENKTIREAFIRSLDFTRLRIDEALRIMLMKFRLPGESQLIERILDTFSTHWFEQNSAILRNSDEALSLAYAIIMLNVDQHSKKVKPMTSDEFDKNLLGPKSDRIYDRKLIDQIYQSIRDNEIILPDEQIGEVRRRYLWKCVMVKSERLNSLYWITSGPPPRKTIVAAETSVELPDATVLLIASNDIPLREINKNLFDVIWSPTVAAMSFIFDKIDTNIYSELPRQVIDDGFLRCASLCAKHGHLDNLVVSLCKFTTNLGPIQVQCQSMSDKNSLAALCLLFIVRDHANSLCESWSNVIRNILQWYCSKLLDNVIEIDDFALQRKVKLAMRQVKKNHSTMNQSSSTFLQSVYSYFAGQQQVQEYSASQSIVQTQASNSEHQSSTEHQLIEQNIIDPNLVSQRDTTHSTLPLTANTVSVVPSASNGNTLIQEYVPSTSLAHTSNNSSSAIGSYDSLKNVNISLIEVIKNTEYRSMESLNELITSLTTASIDCDPEELEDAEVLKLELFTQVVLTNHQLVPAIWQKVMSYFMKLCTLCGSSLWLGERIVSSAFRIAIVFIQKSGFCERVFNLLGLIINRLDPDLIRADHTFTALMTFTVTPESQSPLSSLDALQLKECFEKLIFPFLDRISEQTEGCEQEKLNRYLSRAANLLSKVYLKHLNMLVTLETFALFWNNNVLEVMDRFVKCSGGDNQFKEALFEVVKNMVLVMDHNECLTVEMKDATRTKFIFWGVQSELDY